MRIGKRGRLLAVLCAAGACGDQGAGSDSGVADAGLDATVEPDIVPMLEEIEGLSFTEIPCGAECRLFEMTFEQPVDHQSPDGPRFGQRLILRHRSVSAPTVLVTEGYTLFPGSDGQSEPTAILRANQLSVEHRYFAPSRPEPTDWQYLTIEQAAADHHHIVEAFAPIYPAAWLNTGASKGGMTAVYHRRFWPDDVDGTVAYVAPISFGAPDLGYEAFFDEVGPPACRAEVAALRRVMFERRDELLPFAQDQAFVAGLSYDAVGLDRALESAMIELTWSYWQYWGEAVCGSLPAPDADATVLWSFLDAVGVPSFLSDQNLEVFRPYYVQAYAQLGYPSIPTAAVADLLLFPDEDFYALLLPEGFAPAFDPAAMLDIQGWVESEGTRLLFVYGEWDPWTAGAFELGAAGDSYRYLVPGGTHGAGIFGLVPADQDQAIATLRRWAGVSATARTAPIAWPRRDFAPRGRVLPALGR